MKTLTIELNDDLEKKIETLSAQEGRDEVVVVMEVIQEGLSEKQRRQQVREALEKVLSKPVDGPFAKMTDDQIMEAVEQEITVYRKESRTSTEG
jgi:predicted transcriptional regulator